MNDFLRLDPQDAITPAPELLIPAGILGLATRVVPAIDFHNHPDGGSEEVDDVRPKDDLPAEGDTELTALQGQPEELLRGGGYSGPPTLWCTNEQEMGWLETHIEPGDSGSSDVRQVQS